MLEFKLVAAQLAEHDGHVHSLSHCCHSHLIRAFRREANLARLFHFPHAVFELLMAFHAHQTFLVDAVVVVAAAGVEVVAGLLPVAATPAHAAVLAVADPHGVAIESRARAAARRRLRL